MAKIKPASATSSRFILIPEDLLHFVEKTDIKPGYKTDHSIIRLDLKFTKVITGKGLWKHNDSVLKDVAYLDKISKKN